MLYDKINMTDSEYKLIANDIQIIETTMVDLKVKKLQEVYSIKDLSITCDLSMNDKISNVYTTSMSELPQVFGFIDTTFTCNHVNNKEEIIEPLAFIQLKTKTIFLKKNEELDDVLFRNRVDVACIPLVLPYIKANLQVFASLFNVPFYIPTIDVSRTLNTNNKHKLTPKEINS